MPLKRRAKKGTFGERVKECREENTTYTQNDFTDILKSRYGISMSAAAFSKIELGETRRLDPNLILAIAEIALTNVRYLITGIEPESPTAWSEEAEQVARLIDQMLPRSKQLIKTIAQNLLTIENEQREIEVDITVLRWRFHRIQNTPTFYSVLLSTKERRSATGYRRSFYASTFAKNQQYSALSRRYFYLHSWIALIVIALGHNADDLTIILVCNTL